MGKAQVTEIPGGAKPPNDTISKNLPFRGKFFEMIKKKKIGGRLYGWTVGRLEDSGQGQTL